MKCSSDDLKIDVDKWSYIELVGILKELGYSDIDPIYYKDPTFGIDILDGEKVH